MCNAISTENTEQLARSEVYTGSNQRDILIAMFVSTWSQTQGWTCVKNMAVHRLTYEILLMPRGIHHCSIVFNVLMCLILSLLAFQRKKKPATYSASQRSSMVSTFYSCANVKANASLACTECAWQYESHVIARD